MEMKQIYSLVNESIKEATGLENLVQEDLRNLVDAGNAVFSATTFDHYVKCLVDAVGKRVFVNRKYEGSAPSVLMDGWEFGAVCQKIIARIPEAQENETWQLNDGAVYEQDEFTAPSVAVKFYNKRTTFEVPLSITEKQVQSAFNNAEQMNAFISMIYNACDTALTASTDELIRRTINNFAAETLHAECNGTYTGRTGAKAVNLLYEYNQENGTSLTLSTCFKELNFIKYCAYKIKLVCGRMATLSTLFNIGGEKKFTPTSMLHLVLLDEFTSRADAYLQAETFHNELTKLPNADKVSYWQGSGTAYALADISKIKVKTSENHDVETSGVIGVAFDRDALGVSNLKKYTRSHINDHAEFTNIWFKEDAGYFNDFNENFVVFYIA